MITADSPIIAPSSGSLSQAIDYFGTDVSEYLTELHRLCELTGLSFSIMASQWAVETHDGTSDVWRDRRNPAGIGWTGDPVQNAASQIWANQTDAARGHVVHMLAYVNDPTKTAFIADWLHDNKHYDDRYDYAVKVMQFRYRTIRDLTGKWATDLAYHTKIVNRHRAIFGVKENAADDTSDGASQGDVSNVSTPVIYNLSSDYARFGLSQEDAMTVLGYRFANRTWAGVKGSADFLFFHLQDGTTRSSLDWWANGYIGPVKVTASSHYMVQRDGSILRVIDEQHAAWTNGDDNRPTPAGAPVVALPGNTNLWTVTIEAEGTPADSPTNYPAQMDAIEWLARDIMKRNPNCANRGHQRRHADVNSVTRPNCPGAYYVPIMARIEDAIVDESDNDPAAIWWEPGEDVGIVTRASDGYKANAMLVQTYATTKRDVPVYDQIGGKKIAEVAAGEPAIIGGTTRARDAKATGWYFVRVDGGYGRARASSFLDKLPLP